MQLLPGAEPFRHEGGDKRALLLHGFASSPFEMRYLAERLEKKGYTSVCPLLPGHGTNLDFFARTGWKEWYATALDSLRRLAAERRGQPLAVVGQSLGALLGLCLAAHHPTLVGALACLATPLSFSPVSKLAVGAYRFSPLRWLDLSVPRAGGADIAEPRLRRGLPGYQRYPLKAVASFARLQGRTKGVLRKVRAPLLAAHGRQDHTAPPDNAETLLARVASPIKRLELLPESCHVISLDVEKSRLGDVLTEFLQRHHAPAAGEGPPPRS